MRHTKLLIGAASLALSAGVIAPLALSASGGSAMAAHAASPAPALFGAAPAAAARRAPDLSRGAVERSRYISFRGNLLPKTADDQKVGVAFFDDAQFTATIEHVDHQKLFTSWSGPLDTEYGTFVATRTGDTYSVLANTPSASYLMTRSTDGTYQVAETKPVDNRADDEVSSDAELASAVAASPAQTLPRSAGAAPLSKAVLAPAADRRKPKAVRGGDNGSVTDILVAYTPQAFAAYGGAAGILNEAAYNIAITNASYANSGVRTTARLVGVVPVSGTEVGSLDLNPDLNAFTKRGDGEFDEIFKYIKKTHADDSILLEKPYDTGNYCGLAWESHNQPANRAFAVMATGQCTDGQPTFPHELGHNQGAVHDYYTETNGGFGDNGGKPQFPYGYGYNAPDCAFITMMAYQDYCYQVQHKIVQNILYFSNPDVVYANEATGTAAREDVAKLITKTRKTVARHQQSTLYARGKVAISPKPSAGKKLHVQFKGWINPGVHTKYQWYRDGVKIKHAKHRTYRVTHKDVGAKLAVVVTGKKRHYAPVAVGSNARKVKGHAKHGHGHKGVGASSAAPVALRVAMRPNVGSGSWV